LPEYFDAALAPQREAGRFLVEPGHHYEWVWLLDWYARAQHDRRRPAGALPGVGRPLEFADKFAVDPIAGRGQQAEDGASGWRLSAGPKPSGSRRSTAQECGVGPFGASARRPRQTLRRCPAGALDRTVGCPWTWRRRSRPGHELVSSHGSADRSRSRGARWVARNGRASADGIFHRCGLMN
jgi:hypothetical protein